MKNNLFFLIIVFGLLSCSGSKEYDLESPNQDIKLQLLNQDNKIGFSLTYLDETILKESPLGLEVNGNDFSQNVVIQDFRTSSQDETWTTVNGKNPTVRNHYNEYEFSVTKADASEKVYKMAFRVFDEGFAYRYVFPTEAIHDSIHISGETTALKFMDDFQYWAYNGEHHNAGPFQRSKEGLENLRIPVVLRFEQGTHMAIHEAEILSFAPFSIHSKGEGLSLGFNLDYSPRGEAFKTSWRSFMIGDRAGDLVESNLLVNLNEPCKIEDPSWIKPGKSMWDWRVWGYKAPDGFEYGLNTVSHKRFIDFAAENNIQNLLIDADWYGAEFSEDSDPTSARDGIVIEECMAYAKEKGVGVILYLNDVGARRFGLERVLKQFADWGAVGVKYGFMKGTPEEKVKHTRRVVELCAQYKLMVDFHDNPIPPSGDRRTWPNLVTKEYGHAQADAKRSYFPETAVNTALINMIAGPLDLTNGWFDFNHSLPRVKVFEEIPGTVAAEVAKLIVMYTGWVVLPDAPEAYLAKADLFDAIRQMPAQFDGFQVLNGEIDEFVSIARRAGEDWFVGSLTNREARELTIKLDFLEPGKKYHATLYEDAPDTHFLNNKEAYQIRKDIEVDAGSSITAKLAPGGGHAVWIRSL